MAITNGSQIEASDLNGLFDNTINNLRTVGVFDTPSKQFLQSFRINGINNTTAEYLRTVTFFPRKDCILRGIRILGQSSSAGINITGTVPSQILEDNSIVGGNILNTITPNGNKSGMPVNGQIEFKNVSFNYAQPIR